MGLGLAPGEADPQGLRDLYRQLGGRQKQKKRRSRAAGGEDAPKKKHRRGGGSGGGGQAPLPQAKRVAPCGTAVRWAGVRGRQRFRMVPRGGLSCAAAQTRMVH